MISPIQHNSISSLNISRALVWENRLQLTMHHVRVRDVSCVPPSDHGGPELPFLGYTYRTLKKGWRPLYPTISLALPQTVRYQKNNFSL